LPDESCCTFFVIFGKLLIGGEASGFGKLLCSAPANLCGLPALSVPAA
jgi:hypothetical protein